MPRRLKMFVGFSTSKGLKISTEIGSGVDVSGGSLRKQ